MLAPTRTHVFELVIYAYVPPVPQRHLRHSIRWAHRKPFVMWDVFHPFFQDV